MEKNPNGTNILMVCKEHCHSTLKQNLDGSLIGKVNSTMFIHELRSSRGCWRKFSLQNCLFQPSWLWIPLWNQRRSSLYLRRLLKLLRHFDSQLCIHNIKGRSWQRDGAHVRLLTPYGRLVGKVVLSSVLVTISKIDCWIDGRIPTHNRKRRRVGRGRQKWGRRRGGSESIPWVKPLLQLRLSFYFAG